MRLVIGAAESVCLKTNPHGSYLGCKCLPLLGGCGIKQHLSLNGNIHFFFFLAVLISCTSGEHFTTGTFSADPVSLIHYAVLAGN